MGNVCEGSEHWLVIPGQNCLIQKKRGGSMQNKDLISLHEMNTWCFLWNALLTNGSKFSRDRDFYLGSDKAIND